MRDGPRVVLASTTEAFGSIDAAQAAPFANCEFSFAEEFGNLVGTVLIADCLLTSKFRQGHFDIVEFGQQDWPIEQRLRSGVQCDIIHGKSALMAVVGINQNVKSPSGRLSYRWGG